MKIEIDNFYRLTVGDFGVFHVVKRFTNTLEVKSHSS